MDYIIQNMSSIGGRPSLEDLADQLGVSETALTGNVLGLALLFLGVLDEKVVDRIISPLEQERFGVPQREKEVQRILKQIYANEIEPVLSDFDEAQRANPLAPVDVSLQARKAKADEDLKELQVVYANSERRVREMEEKDEYFNLLRLDAVGQLRNLKSSLSILLKFFPTLPVNERFNEILKDLLSARETQQSLDEQDLVWEVLAGMFLSDVVINDPVLVVDDEDNLLEEGGDVAENLTVSEGVLSPEYIGEIEESLMCVITNNEFKHPESDSRENLVVNISNLFRRGLIFQAESRLTDIVTKVNQKTGVEIYRLQCEVIHLLSLEDIRILYEGVRRKDRRSCVSMLQLVAADNDLDFGDDDAEGAARLLLESDPENLVVWPDVLSFIKDWLGGYELESIPTDVLTYADTYDENPDQAFWDYLADYVEDFGDYMQNIFDEVLLRGLGKLDVLAELNKFYRHQLLEAEARVAEMDLEDTDVQPTSENWRQLGDEIPDFKVFLLDKHSESILDELTDVEIAALLAQFYAAKANGDLKSDVVATKIEEIAFPERLSLDASCYQQVYAAASISLSTRLKNNDLNEELLISNLEEGLNPAQIDRLFSTSVRRIDPNIIGDGRKNLINTCNSVNYRGLLYIEIVLEYAKKGWPGIRKQRKFLEELGRWFDAIIS